MITYKTNLELLIDIDSCVYPKMNIRTSYITDLDGLLTLNCLFETKVIVKDNNGKGYYIPVTDRYRSTSCNLKYFHDRFTEKCETVRNHFETTEGKDVTIEEYKKLRTIETT